MYSKSKASVDAGAARRVNDYTEEASAAPNWLWLNDGPCKPTADDRLKVGRHLGGDGDHKDANKDRSHSQMYRHGYCTTPPVLPKVVDLWRDYSASRTLPRPADAIVALVAIRIATWPPVNRKAMGARGAVGHSMDLPGGHRASGRSPGRVPPFVP